MHFYENIEGISSPKNENSVIVYPHVVPNPEDLRSSSELKLRYFRWNLRAFWPCIDSKTTDAFKTQKGSKDIINTVHVTHQRLNCYVMKLREYFCVQRKQK